MYIANHVQLWLSNIANLFLSILFSTKGTYPAAYLNALNSVLVKGGASCHLLLLTVLHLFISMLSKSSGDMLDKYSYKRATSKASMVIVV